MAIRIVRDHSLGLAEAKLRVDRIRVDVETKFGLSSSWEDNKLTFSGSGVQGKIDVNEDGLVVDVRLGFAMIMLEPAIKSHISSAIDEHLV